MERLQAIQRNFRSELKDLYDEREINSIFMWCLAEIDQLDRKALLLDRSTSQSDYYTKVLEELKRGKPIQYIFGKAYFYGLEFKVNNAVLIPRPETEELVDWIVSQHQNDKLSIMDVGTGSGCIAISLAKALPKSSVYACDVSEEALNVAKNNALVLNEEISFSLKDVLKDDLDKTDIIVSNPPYIPWNEIETMPNLVTSNEPHLALFVDDNDPLIFYRRILKIAQKNSSLCYFEVHEEMMKQLLQLIENMGATAEFRKDLQTKIRMLKVSYETI